MTKKMHGLHEQNELTALKGRDIFETIALIEESLKVADLENKLKDSKHKKNYQDSECVVLEL